MSEASELTEEERQRKHLRLVGYGIAVSGLLTLGVAAISTRPHSILVWGLGGLAVAALVLEVTQGGARGLSIGLITGSFGVWLWPHLDGGSYTVLGAMMIAVGVLNAALTPHFRQLGERLADR
jgi:hypothetical protein